MREKLMDILACPMCGHYPLKLVKIAQEGEKVVEGIIYCENCRRWYPIRDEVAIMLPDNMRDQTADEQFYSKHQEVFQQNGIGKNWSGKEDGHPSARA